MAQKPQTQQATRIMKMSHFSYGKEGADMTNPKPVAPIEAPNKIGSFNIED